MENYMEQLLSHDSKNYSYLEYRDYIKTNFPEEVIDELVHRKIEIDCESTTLKFYTYLKTEFGTFAIPKNTSSSKTFKTYLSDFYNLFSSSTSRIYDDIPLTQMEQFTEIGKIKREQRIKYNVIKIIWYISIKNKDIAMINQILSRYRYSYDTIPLEFYIGLPTIQVDKERHSFFAFLKDCEMDGIDFSKNQSLLFRIESYTNQENSKFIKEHMEEFKKFIYDQGFITMEK